MKNKFDFKLTLILIGGLLFNFLFWNEDLAINLVIHSSFIILALCLDPQIVKNKKFWILSSLHFTAAILVIFNNSIVTIFNYYLSLFIYIGLAFGTQIRAICTAFFAGILQLLASPIHLFKQLINAKIGNFSIKPLLKPLKFIIIPIIAIFIFTLIYSIANPIFEDYTSRLFKTIFDFFNATFGFLFKDLSFERFMHFILGLFFTAGLLLSFKHNEIEKAELTLKEELTRRNKNKILTDFWHEIKRFTIGFLPKKMMALKTENIIGIICFTALNLLLLALNVIDIKSLWINTDNYAAINYAIELHEGANALIVSIFFAIFIVLYFFSGNINFYSKNKTIKLLALIWIIQNAFLIASVFLRDYNYINALGLTYKRIGVIIFLITCAIGLYSVYLKITLKKSFFYLIKINSLTWFCLLFLASFVNWDVFIVDYNLKNNPKNIDLTHLLALSDKTLAKLDQHRAILSKHIPADRYKTEIVDINNSADTIKNNQNIAIAPPVLSINEKKQLAIIAFNKELNERINKFKNNWKSKSWLSWNYRDYQAFKALNQQNY